MGKKAVSDALNCELLTHMERLGAAQIELEYYPDHGTVRAWSRAWPHGHGARLVEGDVADTLADALESLNEHFSEILCICPKCREIIKKTD